MINCPNHGLNWPLYTCKAVSATKQMMQFRALHKLICGSPMCTGHCLMFAHICCTTWCRTYLLCITLGTEHNCDIHQTPFFPHCTMRHMLDCEIYQGGSSRMMWTSMRREDIMAVHSRWHQLVVTRPLSSCSWTRMQTSMHREAILATHSRWHWLVVTRPSSGCSWTRTQTLTCREDLLAAHSRLQAALDAGHETVVWLLLDKDMDVNVLAPMRGMACS